MNLIKKNNHPKVCCKHHHFNFPLFLYFECKQIKNYNFIYNYNYINQNFIYHHNQIIHFGIRKMY